MCNWMRNAISVVTCHSINMTNVIEMHVSGRQSGPLRDANCAQLDARFN